MNKPIFETSYLGTSLKVFKNRLEFSKLGIKTSISFDKIASVHLPPLVFRIDVETTGGKVYRIPTKNKKGAYEAIYNQ